MSNDLSTTTHSNVVGQPFVQAIPGAGGTVWAGQPPATVYQAIDVRKSAEPLGVYRSLESAQFRCVHERNTTDRGGYGRLDKTAWLEFENAWRLCVGTQRVGVEGQPIPQGLDWNETPFRVRAWTVA